MVRPLRPYPHSLQKSVFFLNIFILMARPLPSPPPLMAWLLVDELFLRLPLAVYTNYFVRLSICVYSNSFSFVRPCAVM